MTKLWSWVCGPASLTHPVHCEVVIAWKWCKIDTSVAYFRVTAFSALTLLVGHACCCVYRRRRLIQQQLWSSTTRSLYRRRTWGRCSRSTPLTSPSSMCSRAVDCDCHLCHQPSWAKTERVTYNHQQPDLLNILWQSYDCLAIMPKLLSTCDGRLIYKTSYEECKVCLGYDLLAKL